MPEVKFAAQEWDTRVANDTFKEDLNAILVVHLQETKDLKRKEQQEIEIVKMDQWRKIVAFKKINKKQGNS